MNSHVTQMPSMYPGGGITLGLGAAPGSTPASDFASYGGVSMQQTVPAGMLVPYGLPTGGHHPMNELAGYPGMPMLPVMSTGDLSLAQFEREAAALADGLDNLQLNPRAKEFVPPSLQALKAWPMFAPAALPGGPTPGPFGVPPTDAMLQGMLNNAARGGANVNTMGRGGGRGGRQRQRGGVGVGGSGGGNGGGNGAGGGKKKTVQQGMEANVQRTIYICDIDQQVTEEQLASVFADCGSVIDCRVCGDPNSAMRFAFIEFTTKESAAKAISKTGTVLGQYPLRVLPSKTAIVPVNNEYLPRTAEEREQCSRTVYAANICRKVERSDVARFFQTLCGNVSKIRLLGDSHHNTRIAFVEFERAESAKAALNCSGALLGSLPIRVSPSKTPVRAEPRDNEQ